MRCAFALMVVSIIAVSASANPGFLAYPAYISSERLNVSLDSEAAQIDGRFHFRPVSPEKDETLVPDDTDSSETSGTAAALLDALGHPDVKLEILVWIPSDPKQADPATASFLQTFTANKRQRLDDSNRAVWDKAIGMKITVGNRPLKISTFTMFDMDSRKDKSRVPPKWFREGYYLILTRVEFSPDLLSEDPEIRIQYRQGLRHTETGREFFYVPYFREMPDNVKTTNLELYSMNLTNRSESPLSLGSVTIGPKSSAILPISHLEPVTALITK